VISLRVIALCVAIPSIMAVGALASDVQGPGRFCGYAPVIDLMEGERVTTLESGIHGGSFLWEGSFGSLEVRGIGWASKSPGRVALERTAAGQVRF
jgi:hypothetical protein